MGLNYFTSIDKAKKYFNYMSSQEYIDWWKGVYPFTNRSKRFVYIEFPDFLDIFWTFTTEDEAMSETVATRVANDIKDMNPDVENAMIDALVDREKSKRVEALVACYDRWQKLRTEIRKAERPDMVSVDAKDGKVVTELHSKKAFEALKTLRDKAGKIEKAIEKALKGDPSDAYDIAKNKDDGGSKSDGGDSTTAA